MTDYTSKITSILIRKAALLSRYRDLYRPLGDVECIIFEPTADELEACLWFNTDGIAPSARVFSIGAGGRLFEMTMTGRTVDTHSEFTCKVCRDASLNATYLEPGWMIRLPPQSQEMSNQLISQQEIVASDAICPSCQPCTLDDTFCATTWQLQREHLPLIMVPDHVFPWVQRWIDTELCQAAA